MIGSPAPLRINKPTKIESLNFFRIEDSNSLVALGSESKEEKLINWPYFIEVANSKQDGVIYIENDHEQTTPFKIDPSMFHGNEEHRPFGFWRIKYKWEENFYKRLENT